MTPKPRPALGPPMGPRADAPPGPGEGSRPTPALPPPAAPPPEPPEPPRPPTRAAGQPPGQPSGQPPRPASGPTPRPRSRTRFILTSLAFVGGVLVIAVAAGVLGERVKARWDASATGESSLAPRTTATLAALRAPHEIVIAAPFDAIDGRTRQRVLDVVDEFTRRSKHLSATTIDTNAPDGPKALESLVRRLAERDARDIDSQVASVSNARVAARSAEAYLSGSLSSGLEGARTNTPEQGRESIAARKYLEQAAAAARVLSRDLKDAEAAAGQAMDAQVAGVPLPDAPKAAGAIRRAASATLTQLDALAKELAKLVDANGLSPASVDQVRGVLKELTKRRDALAAGVDPLQRITRVNALRVADALGASSGALVVGPPEVGVAAVDFASLFPSPEFLAAAGLKDADIGRRAEELMASTLASLSGPPRPIVVIVHAEPRAFLDAPGVRLPPGVAIDHVRERLGLRGVDVVEWACVANPEPPSLAKLDEGKRRPVVYVAWPPDSSAAAGAQGAMTGVQRAQRLGEVLGRLADDNKCLLVSLSPSVLPTYGEADPVAGVLTRFGVEARTGRPLLTEALQPGAHGRQVLPERTIQADQTPHAISRATGRLPTYLPWPIPLRADAQQSDVSAQSLLTLAPDEWLWEESQWLRLWQMRAEDRQLARDLPAFDASRDARAPEDGGAYVLALALERKTEAARQRVVVVGSHGWFCDGATRRASVIDGRPVAIAPGNAELLDAAVSWLAFQDDSIAQSVSARVLPVVQPMKHAQLVLVRWSLIAGLPLVILALGVAHRAIRG